ncbi:MAG TPA: hypothetical protein VKQ36_03980, partial [Ktedonobacterales bacterium]|nr:hypothetical protein [Ktedonobacterales bacterium]
MSEQSNQRATAKPTAQLEDLRIGAHAHGRDGHPLGALQRIVVGETDLKVTHLVIDPGLLASGNALAPGGWEKPRARVIPIGLLTNATPQAITLDCDEAEFASYPLFEQERAVPVTAPATSEHTHWWSSANLGEVITYLASELSGYVPSAPEQEITLNEPQDAAAISAGAAVWRRMPAETDETEIGVVERALLGA